MAFHVDSATREADAFLAEPSALDEACRAAVERNAASLPHHAVPRNALGKLLRRELKATRV